MKRKIYLDTCVWCRPFDRPASERIIVNCKIPYNSPSPGGRELEGGGFHPHLNPLPSRERRNRSHSHLPSRERRNRSHSHLPSRERNFIRDYAVNYTLEVEAVKRAISKVDSSEIVILGSSVLLLEASLIFPGYKRDAKNS